MNAVNYNFITAYVLHKDLVRRSSRLALLDADAWPSMETIMQRSRQLCFRYKSMYHSSMFGSKWGTLPTTLVMLG